MKLAWFTPFVDYSAIAHISGRICLLLQEKYGIQVTLFTPHRENLIKSKLKVISYAVSDINALQLKKYDFVVYCFGNYPAFHRDIYLVFRLFPGIVIIHDQTMSNFWQGILCNNDKDQELFSKECEILFGNLPEYHNKKKKDLIQSYDFLKLPKNISLKPVIQNAKGVFTHAEYFKNYVKDKFNLPCEFAYLPPYTGSFKNEDVSELNSIINQAKSQGRKIIVSTGIVGAVKRYDKIAAVLLENADLRDSICFILIGGPGTQCYESLKYLSTGKLKNTLFLLGRQTEGVMFHAIRNADLCINLRYPNTEVCSLSLLEQMSEGKAVLVIDSGIYGEMPDNAVIKLPINKDNLLPSEYNYISNDPFDDCLDIPGEKEAIANVLRDIVIEKVDTQTVGRNAKKHIKENVSDEIYAEKFMRFLDNLNNEYVFRNLQKRLITETKNKSSELFGDIIDFPHYVETLTYSLTYMFNGTDSKKTRRPKTIGIWYAFASQTPHLAREGISVVMKNLCEALVRNYDVRLEVWLFSCNAKPIDSIFAGIPKDKITFVTEKNFAEILHAETYFVKTIGEINDNNYYNFTKAARFFSKADVFIPPILYLDSVIYTRRPVLFITHDFFTSYRYELFTTGEHGIEIYHDTQERADNMARNGAISVSLLKSTEIKQALKYIKPLRSKNSYVVYTPLNLPQNNNGIIDEGDIRRKIGIKGDFLFYPTQVRYNKNFPLLLKAFKRLLEKRPNLKLVLTGDFADVKPVDRLAKTFNFGSSVIKTKGLSGNELCSCYKYAACVPVPSLYEGNFPLQASEAIFMNTPVVLADSDMAREQLEIWGFGAETYVVPLINGKNDEAFAKAIAETLENREAAVERQQPLRKALESRTWDNAAKEYYDIICNIDGSA